MSVLNKIQILLRTRQCFCTSITWKNEVYGDFLTLKIKAGHGQGHLVMLTIQYDILMFAIASTAITSRACFRNLISSPIFNLVYTVVCLHESNY